MMKKLFKKILVSIDSRNPSPFIRKMNSIHSLWCNSGFLNSIRRRFYPLIIKLKYAFNRDDYSPINLHLGCGNIHKEGYINIDLRKTNATDIVCDIKKLPYPDNSVRLIETYHAIEHLSRHDFKKALKEWYRILVPGGKFVVEYPDFDEIVRGYLKGDEKQLDGIFGLQRFEGDYHIFGYNIKRLVNLLEKYGFTEIQEKPPQDYHREEWPCLRVESYKPNRMQE